jgi:MoaA/NifB/PqqE/SkfB family radical SAM enzyme
VVTYHLDLADRHGEGPWLSCVTGWISADRGNALTALGLRVDAGTVVRCLYPFHQGNAPSDLVREGGGAFTSFCVLLPSELAVPANRLVLVAMIAPGGGAPEPWRIELSTATGRTRQARLTGQDRLAETPDFEEIPAAKAGPLLEERLVDRLARQRWLTLRLDLINKCNLRCVMCHYSDDSISKRPARRLSPEEFGAFFAPIAPAVRDVVLSCADEPLMSPHFEAILAELSRGDPEVRIRFCTNAMLLGEKTAAAIIAARTYLVMFSFDGVTSSTLHRIRVGSDYRRIIRNILGLKRLRAASGLPRPRFVFNYVMLASNIHEAPHFVHMAKRLGGDYIDFRLVVPGDFYSIGHEMLEGCPGKFDYYRERILAAADAAGIEVLIPDAFGASERHNPLGDPPCSLEEFDAALLALGEEPGRDPENPRIPEPLAAERAFEAAHVYCDRPFSEVMIRDQKDVYPCPWHREKLGELDGATSMDAIFFGEKFRNLRLAMLDPRGAPGCAGCPIKSQHLPTRMM